MLTPDQLQQVQSLKTTGTSPVTHTDVNAAKASFGSNPVPASESSGMINPLNPANTMEAYAKGTFNNAKAGAQKFASGYQQTQDAMDSSKSLGDRASSMGRGVLNEAAGGIETLASPITSVVSPVFGKIEGGVRDIASAVSNHFLGKEATDKNAQSTQEFLKNNPHADEIMNNLLTVGMSLMGGAKSGEIKGAVNDTVGAASDVAGKVKGVVKPTQPEFLQKDMDLQALQDKISPKPTVKEARLAMDQGRLVKGKEAGLFTKGGADEVLPTDQQIKSAKTIARLIPDYSKMDEPTLYTSLKDTIGKTAEALKPEMEKTVINEKTLKNIDSNWKDLKKQQVKLSDGTKDSSAIIKKAQSDFEGILKKTDGTNMDNLWEARQIYDDSIPDNVRKATDLSPESLQNRKSIWLQNRKIITDAINDTENGLGETSRQAFSDMRDMYEAKNGLLSKAKINVKGTPSQAGQFIENNPLVKTIIKTTGLGAGLHLLP